jgi:hypothetical protein
VPNVSFYSRIDNVRPTLRFGLTFDQLLQAIGPHLTLLKKDDAPMFSACEYHAGHGPNKGEGTRFVVCGHFGVADLDGVHEDIVARSIGRLKAEGIPCRLASTFSHEGKIDDYCVRVIFPFSRQVLVSEWKILWERINAKYFEGSCDKSCKDITRRYYAPSVREGSGVVPVDHTFPGTSTLNVDALLGADVARGGLLNEGDDATPMGVAAGGIKITRDQIRKVRDGLAQSRSEQRRALAPAMTKLMQGDAILEDGEGRHNTIFRLVAEILDRYPLADKESVVQQFAQSIALMQGKTLDEVRDCIDNKQAAPKAALSMRMREVRNATTEDPQQIAELGYTQEGLERMQEVLGATTDELRHQWIIQKGDSFYVQCNGVYRCYGGNEIESAVLRDLAPAIAAGVDLNEVTSQGIRPKKIKELMRDYGQVATEVIVDMREQRSRFDQTKLAMIEAPCPVIVSPKYRPQVDKWLQLLAGPTYEEKLRQWVASFSRLGEPCAALYIEGEKGTGKSLLGTGLAAAFGREPTTITQAFEHFNEALMHCPIVLADEKVPTDLRGRVQTDTMREFIQARSRPLKRKFKPDATLFGCVRLIIAANNRNLLSTTEHLTEHDISAIVERFLHIPAQAEARYYLLDQPVKQWVEEKWIAEHALWLAENLEVPVTGRFLVSGDAKALTNELATSTGLRAGVCQWLTGYLLNPGKFDADALGPLIRVREGRLFVVARALAEKWELYVENREPPPSSAVAKALAGISKEASLRDKHDPAKVLTFREVNVSMLEVWAESTGWSQSSGDIRAALRRIDEVEKLRVN